jgi:hypothetical protein
MPCSKCKKSGHNVRTCPVQLANSVATGFNTGSRPTGNTGGISIAIANITQTCHDEECPICFDKLNNENKLTTVCNHKFCVNCVEKMYNKRLVNCPLCRTVNNHTYKERQFPPLNIGTVEEVALLEIMRRIEITFGVFGVFGGHSGPAL